jgi:hypothetical protein
MTDKDKNVSEFDDTAPDEPQEPRRHGYRGYPNNPEIGGDIHTGTGFAGVGPGGGEGTSRESSLFGDKTQESVEEIKEEEEALERKRK